MNREVCGICWCPYENGACGCKPQTGASMNRDDIIRMAREAGGTEMEPYDYGARPDRFIMRHEVLDRFAALVAAAEREAIIQSIPGGHSVDPQWVCDMIRSRNNP